jgi:hypothetical protein
MERAHWLARRGGPETKPIPIGGGRAPYHAGRKLIMEEMLLSAVGRRTAADGQDQEVHVGYVIADRGIEVARREPGDW